jgi:LmbE family N-acetylglucosaminyl deacetylase
MRLFDPDPRLRWLFCLTHPDDELAIAGWIARLAAAGAEVHLSWTTATPERRWEARDAAGVLGLALDRLHFLNGRDRGVETQLADLYPEFSALIETVSPHRIVSGAFEQGHLDHDATNFLVAMAASGASCPQVPTLLETPFYHAYCQPIPTMNRFAAPSQTEERWELAASEILLKRRLARCYPSQNIFGNAVYYRLLQILRGEAEPLGAVERLRVQTHFDFLTPNLPPPWQARVQATARWKKWLAALDNLPPALFPKEVGAESKGWG